MLRSFRTLVYWWRRKTPAQAVRRALFSEQQQLAKDLRRTFHAYERRLAYLEQRVLSSSNEELLQDEHLLKEAHQALVEVLERLRTADMSAENLLREWRDWERTNDRDASKDHRSRIELLRSELNLRGILPSSESRHVISTPKTPIKKKRSYVPTRLSEDDLKAFDDVYRERVLASNVHSQQLEKRLFSHSEHPARGHSIAKRLKQLHELQKRWKRVLS